MQTVVIGVPAQEGITRDNVTVRVDAVVYFRVVDPVKAIVNVQNYPFADLPGGADLAAVGDRPGRPRPAAVRPRRDQRPSCSQIIDAPTEAPVGRAIERVEVKDVSLPEGMKRSMSRQAEAERERRARVIAADGEFQASKRLAAAAEVMAHDPAALPAAPAADRGRGRGREEQHAGHAVPGRAAALLRPGGRRRPTPREGTPTPRPGRTPRQGREELAKAAEPSGSTPRTTSRRRRPGVPGNAAPQPYAAPRPPADHQVPPAAEARRRSSGRAGIPGAAGPAGGAAGPAVAQPLRPRIARVCGHDEVGVRDRAAAGPRDQADPRQLGRGRLGARRRSSPARTPSSSSPT